MLKLENVKKCYNSKYEKVNALNNVNITLPSIGLYVFMGSSGSGKSTLLNILSGLDDNYDGKVLFNNINIKNIKDDYLNITSYMTQNFALFENLTVYENVNLSLKLLGISNDKLIDSALKYLEIDNLKNKKCTTLSGGEKARVAIARALVKNPKIIICDEPTGNLDEKTSEIVWRLLQKISEKILVIVASHDMDNSYKYGNVIKINDGIIDSANLVNEKNVKVIFKKYKPKKFLSLNLLFKVFNNKKLLYILSILVITITFIINGISEKLANVNIKKSEIEALISNNINEVTLYKEGNLNDYSLYFSKTNLFNLKSILESKVYNISSLLSGDEIFTFSFLDTFDITDYYKFYLNSDYKNNVFVDSKLCNFNIIGNKPINKNEIMISNFLADYIIRLKVNDENNEKLLINNYEELLNKTINVNEQKIIISGIYIVNDEIKDKTFISKDDENLILKYLYTYYINDNFFEISDFNENHFMPGLFNYKIDGKLSQIYVSNDLKENEIYLSSNKDNVTFELIDKNKLFLNSNIKYNLNVVYGDESNIISEKLVNKYILSHNQIKNIILKNFDKKTLYNLINYEKDNIYFSSSLTEKLLEYNISFTNTCDFFNKLSIIFSLFSILVIIIYFYLYYKSVKEKVYFLKTMGVKKNFIKKIFLLNIIIITLLSFILYFIFMKYFSLLTNLYISKDIGYNIVVLDKSINYIYAIFIFLFMNVLNIFKMKKILK